MSERINTELPPPQGKGEDPLLYYTKLFCRFLQLAFATFPKGSFHWDDDDNNTDIIIGDQAELAQLVSEKRPAIIVSRGQVSFGNIAMDQFSSFDYATGKRSHTDLVSCTMVYSCLAKEGLEAQRIAWIAGMATRRLKRALMKAGLHRVGEEVQFSSETAPGSLSPSASENEITMVQVYVPFYFQDWWSEEPEDKILLNNIELGLTSSLKFPAEGGVAIKDPTVRGKILAFDKTVSLDTKVLITKTSTPKPRE